MMDHYRQRKYRGPETWARVREAYVAGESGPSVARRFDVGLANLRKKAMREGWTRSAVALTLDAGLPPRRETSFSQDPGPEAPLPEGRPGVGLPEPVRDTPVLMAITLATQHAAGLLAVGRAAEANVMIQAIANLAKLSGMTADPEHQKVLRDMLLEIG